MNKAPARALTALMASIVLLPPLALLHELLVLGVATLLRVLSSLESLNQLVRLFLASPVHAKIMMETLGGTQALGLAVSGFPGRFLSQLFPAFFLDPELVICGAWVSALIDKNSTVLSVFVTRGLVEVSLLVFGITLTRAGLGPRSIWDLRHAGLRELIYFGCGFLIQAEAIRAIFSLTHSRAFSGLQETGIGIGFSLLLRPDPQQYNWLMNEVLPTLIPFALISIGLAAAYLISRLLDAIGALARSHHQPAEKPRTSFANQAILLAVIAPLLVIFPLQGCSDAPTTVTPMSLDMPTTTPTPHASPSTSLPTAASSETPTLPVTPTAPLITLSIPTASPTAALPAQVEIRRAERGFFLIVNGRATTMAGMNYNVNYTVLPEDVKRARHRRDFQILQNVGANAVIGWGVYDQITLEVAREFEIGVIMPFELDPKGAYENKNYREHVKRDFRAFVRRYQGYHALWGWNPGGDELLHRMDIELHRTPDKLQAAADFLLELSALAYSLDPHHVVIVKEPRDWYIPYIEQALNKARAQPQQPDPGTYLAYGMNVYGTPDLIASTLQTVKRNAEERLHIALVVGEFAPFGLARKDRPSHYTIIWDMVYESSGLGGFAYVFGPDQPNPQAPNPYDPVRLLVSEFSLVDIDGKPVDGALDALATKWRPLRNSFSR